MKIGFQKDGFTMNSQKFDPLNMFVKDHGIEFGIEREKADPLEVLSKLAAASSEEVSNVDRIKAIQSTMK